MDLNGCCKSVFIFLLCRRISQLLRFLKHFPLELLHKVPNEYWCSTCTTIYYWHDPNNASLITNWYATVLGAAFLQKDLVFPGAVLCSSLSMGTQQCSPCKPLVYWGINYSSPLSHGVFPSLWTPCCVVCLLQVYWDHRRVWLVLNSLPEGQNMR